MNWFELKHLAERNQLTEADALEMGEQAKADLKYVKYDEKFYEAIEGCLAVDIDKPSNSKNAQIFEIAV